MLFFESAAKNLDWAPVLLRGMTPPEIQANQGEMETGNIFAFPCSRAGGILLFYLPWSW